MAFRVRRRAHDSIWESTGSSLQKRYASEAMSMSDQDDWEFSDPDAKAEIRAAVLIAELSLIVAQPERPGSGSFSGR